MEALVALPHPAAIGAPLRRFLVESVASQEDLRRSRSLVAELRDDCANLEAALFDLDSRLSKAVSSYSARSEDASGRLRDFRSGLMDLRSGFSAPIPDRGEGERNDGSKQILEEQLRSLAREVARVETVRAYAETALNLESLIGDVEDAVSSVAGKLRSSPAVNIEEIRMTAIDSLRQVEDILTAVTKSRPQWAHLISAVDHKVDHALAVLRPQAIADHRSLLASLGWPPPLSSSGISNSTTGKSAMFLNPLLTMEGDVKIKYFGSFLSLCNLQELQRRRKLRQLVGKNLEIALCQPLWVIEELVNPISLASQRHFSKWTDKPEFIFALAYKITRDFVDSMDEVLQPLVDKVRLVGYSCREEWISAIVTSLSVYLVREIFPMYVGHLQNNSSSEASLQARISWLRLVDLMISFDKRVQSLISNSGLSLLVREDENLQRLSSLSVFCDRPDWLEIWAEIELGEMLNKLKPTLEDEKNWKAKIEGAVLMTISEDYRSPVVAGVVLQCLSNLIDRARSLPSILQRVRFIRLTGALLLREFLDWLLRRCQEAEGFTALADDEALIKVANSINASRYCESTLTDWCEDVFFLEMESVSGEGSQQGCIFEEGINAAKEFRTEWLEKISTVILRGFDALCRDYFKNKRHWQEKTEGWTVSKAFVGALDYVQAKIAKLEEELNGVEFVMLWRSVASSVDQLVFNGVFMSGSKFNNCSVERLGGDLGVLFGVFSAWCLRPEGFFPKLSEGLKLLKMEETQLKGEKLMGKESWLKKNGIRHLTLSEADKIVKNRVFKG